MNSFFWFNDKKTVSLATVKDSLNARLRYFIKSFW